MKQAMACIGKFLIPTNPHRPCARVWGFVSLELSIFFWPDQKSTLNLCKKPFSPIFSSWMLIQCVKVYRLRIQYSSPFVSNTIQSLLHCNHQKPAFQLRFHNNVSLISLSVLCKNVQLNLHLTNHYIFLLSQFLPWHEEEISYGISAR